MPVDFEKFGPPPYVDWRWEGNGLRDVLSSETQNFIDSGWQRVYESRKLEEIGNRRTPEYIGDYNPPIGDEEWSLLSFMLAFSGEANSNDDPARIILRLDSDERFPRMLAQMVTGDQTHDLHLEVVGIGLDHNSFFRTFAPCVEAAYDIDDEHLADPAEEWQPSDIVTNTGWRLIRLEENGEKMLVIEKASSTIAR